MEKLQSPRKTSSKCSKNCHSKMSTFNLSSQNYLSVPTTSNISTSMVSSNDFTSETMNFKKNLFKSKGKKNRNHIRIPVEQKK